MTIRGFQGIAALAVLPSNNDNKPLCREFRGSGDRQDYVKRLQDRELLNSRHKVRHYTIICNPAPASSSQEKVTGGDGVHEPRECHGRRWNRDPTVASFLCYE